MRILHSEKQKLYKNIGKKIKKIRLQKGFSQAKLASLCNFENSNMYRIEAGKTNPTLLTLYKICKALDIKFKDLFDSIEN